MEGNDNFTQLMELINKMIYKDDEKIQDEYYYKKFVPSNMTLDDLIKNNQFNKTPFLTSNSPKDFKPIAIENNLFITAKKYLPKYPCTLIIQPLNKNIQHTLDIIDIYYELFINQIISEFIFVDKIPFYLVNLCNFVVPLDKIGLDVKQLLDKHFDDLEPSQKICVSVYEHFHSYCSLKELLCKDEELPSDELNNIFFQIFFSYAYIQYKLGTFRHNAFNLDAFMVQKINVENMELLLEDVSYVIKNTKYVLKLHHFRYAQMDEFTNMKSIVNPDPSYDIYVILKSFYDYTKINIKNHANVKIIISNFISLAFIEEHALMDEEMFYAKYLDTLIPAQILSKNNFFGKFISMPRYGAKIVKDGGGHKKYELDSEKRFLAREKLSDSLTGGTVIHRGGYDVEDESETTTDDEDDVEHNDDTTSSDESTTSEEGESDEEDDEREERARMKADLKEHADEIKDSYQDEANNEQADTPIDGDNNDTDDIEEQGYTGGGKMSKRRAKLLKELAEVEAQLEKKNSKSNKKNKYSISKTKSYGRDEHSDSSSITLSHKPADETTLMLDEFIPETGGANYKFKANVSGMVSDQDIPITPQQAQQYQSGMFNNNVQPQLTPELNSIANMAVQGVQHKMQQYANNFFPPNNTGQPNVGGQTDPYALAMLGMNQQNGHGLPMVTPGQGMQVNLPSHLTNPGVSMEPMPSIPLSGGAKNADNFFLPTKKYRIKNTK